MCLHLVRVLLVVLVAAAIHVSHAQREEARSTTSLVDLEPEQWKPFFPSGEVLVARDDGSVQVQDAEGKELGLLLQTSPEGDEAIGFSGPSNVLLAVATDGRISGAKIVWSGDTVEHVAAVNASRAFTNGWNGLTLEEAAAHKIDAISGATLTATAANTAVARRLGGTQISLRFPQPLTRELVQRIFPDAVDFWSLAADEQTEVIGPDGVLGHIIRPSRQGIELVGYQGPTDILIGLDPDLKIAGIEFLKSYDNQPYYGYITDDAYFRKVLIGQDFPEFHEVDLYEAGVEGVSGATMTSMNVADMIQAASTAFEGIAGLSNSPPDGDVEALMSWARGQLASVKQSMGALLLIAAGCVIAFSRGRRRVALLWPIFVLLLLGLKDGLLLSMAMFVGWSEVGVTTAGGYGLVALAAVAFFFPVAGGRNVYCSHLCAHGAAQMLVRNRLPRGWRLPKSLLGVAKYVPGVLVAVVVVAAVTGSPLNLVDLEAFDAYLWPVCGWIPLVIAIGGLLLSLFEPMAYCRFGCPTGSLLDYVRRHRRSDRWTRVDWFATALAATAWGLIAAI